MVCRPRTAAAGGRPQLRSYHHQPRTVGAAIGDDGLCVALDDLHELGAGQDALQRGHRHGGFEPLDRQDILDPPGCSGAPINRGSVLSGRLIGGSGRPGLDVDGSRLFWRGGEVVGQQPHEQPQTGAGKRHRELRGGQSDGVPRVQQYLDDNNRCHTEAGVVPPTVCNPGE
jgi:hypothetical protein